MFYVDYVYSSLLEISGQITILVYISYLAGAGPGPRGAAAGPSGRRKDGPGPRGGARDRVMVLGPHRGAAPGGGKR